MQVTKTITLVNGGTTLVDEQDYERYGSERWFRNARGYAWRQGWRDGKHWQRWLHREINQTPPHLFTDHINGNKLDNRCCNLRTVTKAQNGVNTGKIGIKNATSRFKGVSLHRSSGLWRSRVEGGTCTYHRTDDAAARAYNAEAKRLYGDCVKLNAI